MRRSVRSCSSAGGSGFRRGGSGRGAPLRRRRNAAIGCRADGDSVTGGEVFQLDFFDRAAMRDFAKPA